MSHPNALTDIPAEKRASLLERIDRYTEADPSTGCLLWTGKIEDKGYGQIWLTKRRAVVAHRVAWILARGPIADPLLVLDHLCRNRACVNPDHLELVTDVENSRRGDSWKQQERHKGDFPEVDRVACKHGHPWPQYAALRRMTSGQMRVVCLECKRVQYRRWYAAAMARKRATAAP